MLIRDDAEAIQIENNAVITYDSNITIQSDGKETEIIKEGAAQPGKQNTLIVPYGSHSSIVLADGSKVWLIPEVNYVSLPLLVRANAG